MRRALGLMLLGASALSCSCASASEPAPGGVDGPVVYSGSSDGSAMDAIVSGSLVFENSCLYLTHAPDFPEIRSLVMWPLGTSWQQSPPAVVLPGGDQVEPGDFVEGGGGYLKLDTLERVAGPEGSDIVDMCREGTDENVAFFNEESKVDVIDD